MNNNRILSSASVSGRSALATLTIALVVLFASTAVFASSYQGQFERTLQVSGPVDLEVLTRSGDVTVRAGSGGSVFIRGKIHVGDHWLMGGREADVHEIEQHPPIRQDGNRIHIEYVNMRNISLDYEISVPADTTVRTRSGSGDQIIEGTRGNVDTQTGSWEIHTGSGNVHVRLPANAAFDADISTSSGTVDMGEPIEMTVQGRIGDSHKQIRGKVHGGGPLLRVRTGSGDIHIQ